MIPTIAERSVSSERSDRSDHTGTSLNGLSTVVSRLVKTINNTLGAYIER